MPEESVRPRIYLEKVHLKGFRSIKDLSVNLKAGLNIIIGKNGSGKSNFMEGLFQASSPLVYQKLLFDFARLSFLTPDEHLLSFEYERFLRKSHLDESDPSDRIGLNERFFIDKDLKFDSSSDEQDAPVFTFNNKKTRYSAHKSLLFNRLGYVAFITSYLKYDIPTDLYFIDSPGSLKIDSKNPYIEFPDTLTSVSSVMWGLDKLFEFSEDDDELAATKSIKKEDILEIVKVHDEVKENLNKYTPIKDVRFNTNINFYKEGDEVIIENIKLEFKINQNWMPWSYLSDGTQRLFYIVSEITHNDGLILIEEPELGVHPHQFALLMDFLREQAESKQIIISTHSPKALDHFSDKELDRILICSYDLKKGTQIRHLSSKEVNKAKKYMKEVGFFSDYWLLSDLE
jgi:predicted ATPase